MSFQRPTYSEHWYRVCELKPRLRFLVQVSRQHFRGKLWYVLRDTSNNQFVRVDEYGYRFLGMLDGRRTVEDVWHACSNQVGDYAPTQGEAIQLLGQLYANNMLEADVPADVQSMFKRQKKRVRREVGSYLMSIMFARIPIYDPDWLLNKMTPLIGWLFGPIGWVLWTILVVTGLSALAGRADELIDQSSGVLSPDNLVWLYGCMVLIKLLHELGHGVTCKRFGLMNHSGGEVHTLGVMFLVFVPMPYVDASSAWAFRSKWQRIYVSCAGMYVEIAVAMVGAIIWSRSASGTVAHALSYNLIFIAGVSTILFNINPLIKFDGYFILSDLFDMPNLMQRSKEMLHYWVKKYAYKVEHAKKSGDGAWEMFLLTVYAIASSIYRVFLSVSILMFVADKLFFVGAIMFISGLFGWVLVPVSKFLTYLFTNSELTKTRLRAITVSSVTLAALGVLLAMIPVPDYVRAEGVAEPIGLRGVHAEADSFAEAFFLSGSTLKPDQIEDLFVGMNADYDYELRQLRSQQKAIEVKYQQAVVDEPAVANALKRQLVAIAQKLVELQKKMDALRLDTKRYTFDQSVLWYCKESDLQNGVFVKHGQLIGYVAPQAAWQFRIAADQYAGPQVLRDLVSAGGVELKPMGCPAITVKGQVVKIVEGGRGQLPSVALGLQGGGNMQVDMTGQQQPDQAVEPYFEVLIKPTDFGKVHHYWGNRYVARFQLSSKPLISQLWIHVRQVIQKRFMI